MMHRLIAVGAACALLAACGGPRKDAGQPAAPAPGHAAAPSAAAPAAPETGGQTLSATDEKLATGQYYDAYPLRVEAGKGTVITVHSRGFRPVLVILDSNRQKISETEALTANGDGGYTVELSETYPEGNYYVLVCASDVGATGGYTVEAQTSTPIG